jgi:hypothetical protein
MFLSGNPVRLVGYSSCWKEHEVGAGSISIDDVVVVEAVVARILVREEELGGGSSNVLANQSSLRRD